MKKSILHITIIACCLIFLNTSCTHTVYTPSTKGTYTVHQKGQILMSSGVAVSPNYLNINVDAAYSPLENIGFQLNFENSNKYKNIGIAAGYYKAKYNYMDTKKTGFHFDGYLGYSINKASGRANDFQSFSSTFNNDFRYIANYQDIYLTAGIHFFWQAIGIDFVYKPHLLDIYSVDISGDIDGDLRAGYDELAKSPFLVHDFTGKISLGSENFQVFGATNISINKSSVERFMDPFSLTAGFNINLSNLIFPKKDTQ